MGGLTHRSPITVGANFDLVGNVNLITVPEFSPGIDNTGITLSLPYAGTYTIYFSVSIVHSGAGAFDNRWVFGYLYDDTATAYIPGASAYLLSMQNLAPNGDLWPGSGTIVVTYTTTTPRTIRLLTARHSISSNCTIIEDETHYGYTCTY